MIPIMSTHTRLISFLIGIIILMIIFLFVRKKYLDQIYSFVWIVIGIFFIFLSFFPKILNIISSILGIDFSPIGILVVSIVGLGAIILHMSTIITNHNRRRLLQ